MRNLHYKQEKLYLLINLLSCINDRGLPEMKGSAKGCFSLCSDLAIGIDLAHALWGISPKPLSIYQ